MAGHTLAQVNAACAPTSLRKQFFSCQLIGASYRHQIPPGHAIVITFTRGKDPLGKKILAVMY